MNTQCLSATDAHIALAAELLQAGAVVGMPTETVYGLAANALDDAAVRRIFAAKRRPADNPLIVHIASVEMIAPLISGDWADQADRLAKVYWPGPLTMIVKKSDRVAPSVSPYLDTVSLRMPSHPVALKMIEASGLPLAAPSANRSGRPSPTSAQHVLEDMLGEIPLIIDGGECEYGLESTVIDMTCEPPKILRPGAVTPEMIAAVIGEVEVDERVLMPLQEGEHPASPGMKYRHYAPKGKLTIVASAKEGTSARIAKLYDEAVAAGMRCCILAADGHDYGNRHVYSLGADAGAASHKFFAALREMDAQHIDEIYCEGFEPKGIGLALMNRMARAAGFSIIDEEG